MACPTDSTYLCLKGGGGKLPEVQGRSTGEVDIAVLVLQQLAKLGKLCLGREIHRP
jgi:hypothetical protein